MCSPFTFLLLIALHYRTCRKIPLFPNPMGLASIFPIRTAPTQQSRTRHIAWASKWTRRGRMDTAVDTISATMTQKSAADADTICVLLVRIVAVAFTAVDGCYDARGGIDAGALGVGEAGSDVGSILRTVDGVRIAGENAQGKRLATTSPNGRWRQCSNGGIGVQRVSTTTFRRRC